LMAAITQQPARKDKINHLFGQSSPALHRLPLQHAS
jgi:hypothetical protein